MKTIRKAAVAAGAFLFSASALADLLGVQFDGTVWRINENTGAGTLLSESDFAFNALARSATGSFYSAGGLLGTSNLYTIDPMNGSVTVGPTINLGSNVQVRITGLSFSPSGALYAVNAPAVVTASHQLYTLNTTSGVGTLIGATGALTDIAFGTGGGLFGWDVSTGAGAGAGLVSVNAATGAITEVNPLVPGDASQIQALTFSDGGVLWGARSALNRVNTASGSVSLVANAPLDSWEDLRGIAFIPDTTTVIPEPSTVSLLGLGLAVLVFARRRIAGAARA